MTFLLPWIGKPFFFYRAYSKRNFSFFPVRVYTLIEKGGKNAELLLLKVYPYLNFERRLKYSRHSLSRSRRDPLKDFGISVLRHIRFAELKIPMKQPHLTKEHV